LDEVDFRMNYWDTRYRDGGASGKGSVGSARRWKWRVIRRCVPDVHKRRVLDVGCGDVSFLEGRRFESYLGIDASPTVIQKNRKRRPDLRFEVLDAADSPLPNANVVFCMDVLFHIMRDVDYEAILENLGRAAQEWLFVATWRANPLESSEDNYQKFRPPATLRFSTFKKIGVHTRPFDPYNTLYVFRRNSP
jgi:SAM-dependent methyltransferase